MQKHVQIENLRTRESPDNVATCPPSPPQSPKYSRTQKMMISCDVTLLIL